MPPPAQWYSRTPFRLHHSAAGAAGVSVDALFSFLRQHDYGLCALQIGSVDSGYGEENAFFVRGELLRRRAVSLPSWGAMVHAFWRQIYAASLALPAEFCGIPKHCCDGKKPLIKGRRADCQGREPPFVPGGREDWQPRCLNLKPCLLAEMRRLMPPSPPPPRQGSSAVPRTSSYHAWMHASRALASSPALASAFANVTADWVVKSAGDCGPHAGDDSAGCYHAWQASRADAQQHLAAYAPTHRASVKALEAEPEDFFAAEVPGETKQIHWRSALQSAHKLGRDRPQIDWSRELNRLDAIGLMLRADRERERARAT